jgi:hypothetical protein
MTAVPFPLYREFPDSRKREGEVESSIQGRGGVEVKWKTLLLLLLLPLNR